MIEHKSPSWRKKKLEATQRNQAMKLKLIQDYKMATGCFDCGYKEHPEALDLDHRPGTLKVFNIGGRSSSRGMKQILTEIEKCDVVCANCHRVRTAERRGNA